MQAWLADQVEVAAKERKATFSLEQMVASLQDDPHVLAVCELLAGRRDFSLSQLVAEALFNDMVPNHRFHIYKPAGLVKREAWERTWEDQCREDAGEKVTPECHPATAQAISSRPNTGNCAASSTFPKSDSLHSPRSRSRRRRDPVRLGRLDASTAPAGYSGH